jgi:type IV pilus assembly protein PilV
MQTMRPGRGKQQGVMLLEALIGILIFSIGILAMVGMQAVAIRNVSDAQFRSEAAFLANDIMSEIWIDQANAATYDAPAGVNCPGASVGMTPLQKWACRVARLPGVTGVAANLPRVTVGAAGPAPANVRQISVEVRWQAPNAPRYSRHTAIGFVSSP